MYGGLRMGAHTGARLGVSASTYVRVDLQVYVRLKMVTFSYTYIRTYIEEARRQSDTYVRTYTSSCEVKTIAGMVTI